MKINISSPPQHIVETQQQEHVFSERNIMSEVRHQFITRSETIRSKGEYADLDRDRFNQLFDDTILEGSKESFSMDAIQ